MDTVVIGVDAGGTATRAVAATLDGHQLGRGQAGAANPVGRPPRVVTAALATALGQALQQVPVARVRGGTIGIAGRSAADTNSVREAIDAAWRGAGLPGRPQLVSDAVVAYAAGTPEPDGVVLIAGTGAVAARLQRREITGTADGLGWLLGDEGSGFWLGLAAARATAHVLATGGVPTLLVRGVTAQVGASDLAGFVARCYRQPRRRLAALAGVVCRSAAAGDATAQELVEQAAVRLSGTLGRLASAQEPVVLGGGLLANPTPVRAALLRTLAAGGTPPPRLTVAQDGAAGAAWLAALHTGAVLDPADLHRRLCQPGALSVA